MMLYPTVQELTNEKVNRYALVIATAKCARHLIDKSNIDREEAEAVRIENDRFSSKDQKYADNDILLTEKPVSVAVQKLYDGEYTIVAE